MQKMRKSWNFLDYIRPPKLKDVIGMSDWCQRWTDIKNTTWNCQADLTIGFMIKNDDQKSAYALGASLGRYMENSLECNTIHNFLIWPRTGFNPAKNNGIWNSYFSHRIINGFPRI